MPLYRTANPFSFTFKDLPIALFAPKAWMVASMLLFLTGQSLLKAQVSTDGLVLHWAFEETAAGQITDSSPSGNNGSYSGSVSRSTAGRIGSCLQAASGAAWMASTSSLTWTPSAFTIGFWINPVNFQNYNNTLAASSGYDGFAFQTTASGAVYAGTANSDASRFSPADLPAGTVELNQWQYISFSYAAGTGRFYKNGILLKSKPMVAPIAWSYGFYISGNTTASSVHGRIDELRIYNRALTDQEMFSLAAYPNGPVSSIWSSSPVSSNWSDPANWIGGAVPTTTSEVTVNTCTVCPALPSTTTIARLIVNGGKLSLGTYNLRANSLKMINGTLNSSAATLSVQTIEEMQNSKFYGNITFNVNDGQQSPPGFCRGGNTFYNDVEFIAYTHPASSFMFGNGTVADVFKGNARFRNTGQSTLYISHINSSVFEKDLEIRNENTNSKIRISFGGGTTSCWANTLISNFSNEYVDIRSTVFTGTVTLNGTRTPGFNSCTFQSDMILQSTGVTVDNSVFGPNATLRTPIDGVDLTNATWGQTVTLKTTTFQNPVQSVNIWFKNSVPNQYRQATCMIGPSVVFNGKVNMNAHYFELNGADYKAETVIEKTGPNTGPGYGWNGYGQSSGGNTFRSSLTLTNSSGYDMKMAVISRDSYHGNLTLTYGNTGCPTCTTGTLQVAASTANTYFGGDITVSSLPGAKGGIILGAATLPWQLLSGKQLLAGSFPAGSLTLSGFQQQDTGDFPLSLTSTAILVLGRNNLFQGSVIATAPNIYLNGSVFLKPSTFTKTGAGDNVSVGGNSFKSKLLIINQATSGSVQMATQSNDIIDKAVQ